MTTEELAATGLPVEPEVQDREIAQPPEERASSATSGSGTHEDGEIRSEEEDVGNVDADVKDLIVVKQSGPLPPSFVFGESKVTANLIREYEAAGFFPAGTGRAPLDEQVPTPEAGEIVIFHDFFTCGLRSLVQYSTSMTKRFGHGTSKFGHGTLFYDQHMTKLNWSQKLRHIWSTMTNRSFWS
jgi:hypothetical protein